jgi:hypothetical protein
VIDKILSILKLIQPKPIQRVEVEIEKSKSMKEFVEKSKKEQARYFKEYGT